MSALNSFQKTSENLSDLVAYPAEPLVAELRRLDLLLHREILRLRASYQLSLDEFRGLYISDEHVDALVAQTLGRPDHDIIGELTVQAEALRIENGRRFGPEFPWCRLRETFGLTSEEQDLLLVALAPELDLKYETLYAYLNNDVTRKWPTCELALRVLASDFDERMVHRELLFPQAKLFDQGILRLVPAAGDRPRWLAGGITATPCVVNYLLDQPGLDQELAPLCRFYRSDRSWSEVRVHHSIEQNLRSLARSLSREMLPAVLILGGRPGSDRTAAAEAFAEELAAPVLNLDLQAARAAGAPILKLTNSLLLYQRLYGAVLCLSHGEVLVDKDSYVAEAKACFDILSQASKPIVITAPPRGPWRELAVRLPVFEIELGDLPSADRARVWREAAERRGCEVSRDCLDAVSDRFVLTPGQIESAVASVAQGREVDREAESPIEMEKWLQAARDQSNQGLGQLASKVHLVHEWRDLVLPLSILRQLKQITGAIRNRRRVYEDWGFERRVSIGRGLKLLFAGPSGTGKTMTAGVIARELGLDLYKIDLSGVVSKYIGETEKNLERIFRAAQCSNAILFFDEADALFGKRSEVKDAHDRYANVEVAYLLQKLEEHDGAVILATNLTKNIDEAFARRMHYAVRFPLPDASDRQRLWRGMFPPEAPLASDIDFEFLSTQFPFAGGDIKNVALDAAFRAAADGGMLAMPHLLRAVAQQLLKDGRTPSVADFRHYYAFLAEDR